MSELVIRLSFLDAMSALWRPESERMIIDAVYTALGTDHGFSDVEILLRDVTATTKGLYVRLFVRPREDSADGYTLHFIRKESGLVVRAIGHPPIPQSLLNVRIIVHSSWLADA